MHSIQRISGNSIGANLLKASTYCGWAVKKGNKTCLIGLVQLLIRSGISYLAFCVENWDASLVGKSLMTQKELDKKHSMYLNYHKKILYSFTAEKPTLQFHVNGQIFLVPRSKVELSFFGQFNTDDLKFLIPTHSSLIPC